MKKLLLIGLLLFSPAFAADWVHLYDPVNQVHYDNGGFIPIDSSVPVEGWQWVLDKAPEGSKPYNVKTKAEQLDEVYNSQPAIKRAQYAPLKAAVNLLLEQGDVEAVKVIIEATDVPQEDSQLKEIMLQLLK